MAYEPTNNHAVRADELLGKVSILPNNTSAILEAAKIHAILAVQEELAAIRQLGIAAADE